MSKEGKGIWHGGITKPNGNDKRMSEEEARFWRGFEDYNDNVGLDSDFSAEYIVEKEMRNSVSKPKVSIEMSGGDPIRKFNNDDKSRENNSKPEVSK